MTTKRLLEAVRAILLSDLTPSDWGGQSPRIAPQIAETDGLTAGSLTITTRVVGQAPLATFQGTQFGSAVVRCTAIGPVYEAADRLAGGIQRVLGAYHGKPKADIPPLTARLEERIDNALEVSDTSATGFAEVEHHIGIDIRITRG